MDPAGENDEHPLLAESLEMSEQEFMPFFMAGVVYRFGSSCKRYMCTAICAGCLAKPLLGRKPSVLSALVGPGILFGVGFLAEIGARFIASRVLQWRACFAQRKALLTDVEHDFLLPVPHDLECEERIVDARVWVTKASLGVTSIWFRRLKHRGWMWTADLRHWQSVQHHRIREGIGAGLLPVPSNRWLLRRLRMRDVRDKVRPPRAAHAPPPLTLPDDLEDGDVPADFLCPITASVMTDPVVGPAGVSYERAALVQWLRLRRTDPSTQCPLETHDLYANLNLRNLISVWTEAHAGASSETTTHADAEPPQQQQQLQHAPGRPTRRRRSTGERTRPARRLRDGEDLVDVN
jgi:hypothetical protein